MNRPFFYDKENRDAKENWELITKDRKAKLIETLKEITHEQK